MYAQQCVRPTGSRVRAMPTGESRACVRAHARAYVYAYVTPSRCVRVRNSPTRTARGNPRALRTLPVGADALVRPRIAPQALYSTMYLPLKRNGLWTRFYLQRRDKEIFAFFISLRSHPVRTRENWVRAEPFVRQRNAYRRFCAKSKMKEFKRERGLFGYIKLLLNLQRTRVNASIRNLSFAIYQWHDGLLSWLIVSSLMDYIPIGIENNAAEIWLREKSEVAFTIIKIIYRTINRGLIK